MAYDNTNRGSLFKNDKDGNESRPDYKGSLNVNGQEFWISAWLKVAGENSKMPGQKFMSLQVQLKEAKPAPPAHGAPDSAFCEDDAPF